MVVIYVLISLIVIYLILFIISRCVYGRSVMATLCEWYLFITEKRMTDEEVIKNLPLLPNKNAVEYSLPKRVKITVPYQKINEYDMQVFYFNTSKKQDTVILYLHGGGYVRQPRYRHFKFVNKLSKKSGVTVVFPLYLKAPKYTYKSTYRAVKELYDKLANEYDNVILMGDSSGGGLALSTCQRLVQDGEKLPTKLILLSPWVDVSLSNSEVLKYEKYDPIVSVSNERIWGKAFAGDIDVKHKYISPIYGSMKGLPKTYIVAGTREALYPDLVKTYQVMLSEGVNVTLIEGKGLNHVYPIYPTIEAKLLLKNFTGIINEK